MEFLPFGAFFLVGVLAGLVGGLLGLSGGVIAVPSLVLLFKLLDFPQTYLVHMAIGTSLSAMVLTGIASSWMHHRKHGIDWMVVLHMFPGVVMGALLGAFLASFISGIILQVIFGVFLALLGCYMLLSKGNTKQFHPPQRSLYTWLGLGIGTASSMLGIGGGVFTVPLLLSYHFSAKRAVGTSCAIGLCITFLASLGYLYYGRDKVALNGSVGYVYLPAFICVGIGTILFAPLGAKLAHKLQGPFLTKLFASTLLVIGVLMIFN